MLHHLLRATSTASPPSPPSYGSPPNRHHPTRRHHYRTHLKTPPLQLSHSISVFKIKKKTAVYSGFYTNATAAGPAGRRLDISKLPRRSTNNVQHLPELRIAFEEVYFYAIDTNAQALLQFAAKKPLQIGELLTRGLALSAGSGGNPLLGEQAAEESKEAIAASLRGSNLVFMTAGMGGGTGSGSAPVVAQISREAGYLTVGVATYSFNFEGCKRSLQVQMSDNRLHASCA